ncbi:9276_t:CDS:2, partial [Entrophospora sp. SA101]
EKAKLFRKEQEDGDTREQKFGIVSIKAKEKKIVAFLLTYKDPSIPSDNKQFQEALSLVTKDKEINLERCRFFQQKEQSGIYLHHNKKIGAVVLIQGGNEEIAHELALQIVANKPQFLSLDSIPREILEKEKQKFFAQAQEENPGKNPEIIQRIVQGKLNKHLTSTCFLEQSNFRDPETKIKDYLAENQVKIKDFYLLAI